MIMLGYGRGYLGNVDNVSDADLQPLADKLHISVEELRSYSGQIIPVRAKSYEDFKRQYNQIWHYEGSELQRGVEARTDGYKKNNPELYNFCEFMIKKIVKIIYKMF